jgi:hypothetical protein
LHLLTAAGYGYFRDELYYIACSNRLAFGYVDQPPFSILLLRLQRWVLGDSLIAIRFLPAIAGAANVYFTGLIVKELGGGVLPQILAMAAVIVAPEYLAVNHYYSMNSFDLLFWTIATFQLLRTVRLKRATDWILLGVILGFGLMNKISILWLAAGIFAGLILSSHRFLLKTRGPWLAAAIGAVIFLPYVLWQIQNDWATLEFMRNATTEKMAGNSATGFLVDQLLNMNPVSAPLWIGGLLYCFLNRKQKELRLFGWIYGTTLAILLASPASRSGYLAPAYTALFAAGAVAFDRLIAQKRGARLLVHLYIASLLIVGALLLPLAVPVLPPEDYIQYAKRFGVKPSTEERKEVGDLPQFYADMFGWQELTRAVADVYSGLPDEERKQARIFTNNYGQAGAIDFFGKQYGLPPAISSHNNYWIWGPGDFNGQVLIITGGTAERKLELFEDVQEAATMRCDYCMPYENNKVIFVCRRARAPVSEIWAQIKHYD